MTTIFDPFSALDPQRERDQIATAFPGVSFDNFTALDPARQRSEFEASAGQTFDVFSALDPKRERDQIDAKHGSSYYAKAVHFDGTVSAFGNDNLNVDAYTGLESVWLKMSSFPSDSNSGDLGSHNICSLIGTNGNFNFNGMTFASGLAPALSQIEGNWYDLANVNFFSRALAPSEGALPTDTWFNILASWDFNHPSSGWIFQLLITAVDRTADLHTVLSGGTDPILINYSDTFICYGDGSNNYSNLIADVADHYFAAGQPFFDLTSPSNVAKFIKNGKPVDLGADGSLPTGSRPNIFNSGNATDFKTNRGTNAALTWTGALGSGVVSGAGPISISLPGAQIGQTVTGVFSTDGIVASGFESNISVANQVQQTGSQDFTGKTLKVCISQVPGVLTDASSSPSD